MEDTTSEILRALEDPVRREMLYRQDSKLFRDALETASQAAPDSETLRVWRARLEYRDEADESARRRMWRAVGVGLAVGLLVRLPASWLGAEWYYPRLAPSLVILSLAAYFWLERADRRRLIAGLTLTTAAIVYTALLPDYTDSVSMALIHLPILFWGFLGYVFTSDSGLKTDVLVRFIRYNGELLILASLVGLGGMVFSGITVALFELVSSNSATWYFMNVGVFGAVAVPVAATYLYDVVLSRCTGIPPALARVFAPLFLIMSCTYLAFALTNGKNPFVDRDFLITVNGLLLVVLCMTVFSISERGERTGTPWSDYVNVALLVVTLIIDAVALSAIFFRLASYGFTPNRVVVLGANLVIMTHLVWTGAAYIGLVRKRVAAGDVLKAVVGYLPVYIAWAAIVTFVLPVVFGFS